MNVRYVERRVQCDDEITCVNAKFVKGGSTMFTYDKSGCRKDRVLLIHQYTLQLFDYSLYFTYLYALNEDICIAQVLDLNIVESLT